MDIAKNNKIHSLELELQKKELERKLLEQENKHLKEENTLLKQIVNHPPPYDFPVHVDNKGTVHRIPSPFEKARDAEIDRLNKLQKKLEKEKHDSSDSDDESIDKLQRKLNKLRVKFAKDHDNMKAKLYKQDPFGKKPAKK